MSLRAVLHRIWSRIYFAVTSWWDWDVVDRVKGRR